MIVRILGAGQWRVADDQLERLNGFDDQVQRALENEDQAQLDQALAALVAAIRSGDTVADDELSDSDLIVPDAGASLAEVRAWLAESGSTEGLIPG